MTSEQYRRVGELYHAAMGLVPAARVDFLTGACGNDDELRREVESLLEAHKLADSYFGAPALELAAEILAQQEIASLAGRRLGHYEVRSLIAAGGMGQVFLADDTRLGRKVALKVLPTVFTADPDRIRRFEQEAKAASALNQPNILTIHEIGEVDGCHFIVSEYVEGEMLRQLIENGEMTYRDKLDVATQVANALAVAHAAGITHRDIKPENVIVRPDGLVKVLDFGLAKLTESPESINAGNAESVPGTKVNTESGMVMGTPNYMSPEQARGLKVDARSDLFSLGVVLYEMIAGRPPFEGETPTDVIISIVQQKPAPLTHFAPETPPELEQIIAKALGKDRDERYQTATELLADLKGLQQRLELQAASEGIKDAAAPVARDIRRSRARWAWVGALSAVAVSGVLITLWVWLGTSAAPVPTETPAIAVLPFKNLSGEKESEYLADGLTDELIRNLSIIEGLEVRSRTSSFAFKDKPHDIREVGEMLNVNYVLDGSVLRSGGKLRINAQFIRVSDDKPLWAEKFDKEPKDIFKIQDEIALGIVNQLRLRLGSGRRRYETNVEAYDLYLRARGQSGARGFGSGDEAVRIYEQVISKDPLFAPAWAGLASTYAYQSIVFLRDNATDRVARIRPAAEKAIQLDPLLSEGHAALAMMHARNGEWVEAENSFRQAIKLDPNRSDTYTDYSNWFLLALGRIDDALEQLQYADKADPLSPYVKSVYGSVLIAAGRYDDAAAYFQQLPDDFNLKNLHIARVRFGQGRNTEAIQLLENDSNLSRNPTVQGGLGYIYARSGRRELAEKMAAASQFPNEQALIFAGLGDKDRALKALERMGSRGPQRVGRFLSYPEFAFLRGDPRLAALRKKVGLPEEK